MIKTEAASFVCIRDRAVCVKNSINTKTICILVPISVLGWDKLIPGFHVLWVVLLADD
eukprot:SAG11_NODE_5528_length_1534_cov_2.023693_3_plen_57_part_01